MFFKFGKIINEKAQYRRGKHSRNSGVCFKDENESIIKFYLLTAFIMLSQFHFLRVLSLIPSSTNFLAFAAAKRPSGLNSLPFAEL